MFLESNFTETFEKADEHCKEKLSLALKDIKASGPSISYETIKDLYANDANIELAFYIEQGAVCQQLHDRTLFHHDVGDIIGLDMVNGTPRSHFSADSLVLLRPYKRDTLWRAIFSIRFKQILGWVCISV